MIEKITVRNYQSLYSVEVKLGKFTVIYGNSDVGKSAFYRAIRGLIVTEVGDDFISVETNRTGVSIKEADFDDGTVEPGFEVVWLKSRGKSSTYLLYQGGEKIKEWRRARSLPGELEPVLRMRQVSVDGDKFYPNLRGQFDPLFLLFESSSKRARVLGSLVSNLLLSGIKTANTERNRNEADIRAIGSLADDLERKMEVNWQALADKAAKLEAYSSGLEKRFLGYLELERKRLELGVIEDAQEGLRQVHGEASLVLSDVHEVQYLIERYEGLLPLVKKYRALKKLQVVEVASLPEVDLDRLLRIEVLLEWARPLYAQVKALKRDLYLSNKEVGSFEAELEQVEIMIKETTNIITCPHCGKEFEYGTE